MKVGSMAIRIVKVFARVRLKDFLAPFVFLLLLIPSFFFRVVNKINHRKLWLVAEDGDARDNGYHFYKYVREEHSEDFCFYAVKKNSAGYKKISMFGNLVDYGSLKHWLYYMSADLNISSQKSGNPCPIFWYIMHVVLGLYKNRVFLQHGITKDDSKWLYYNKTKFKYFICGAKKEYDFIKDRFGYLEDSLLFTGFPRWDALKRTNIGQKDKTILIMPTWRNWLGGKRNKFFEIKNFKNTEFFKCWNGLLDDDDFVNFVEKNNLKVYFYPHINMQMFLENFKPGSKNIKIISSDEDVQKYLNECDLMITDYSSVAFDFAYLSKPILYYQFDLKEYRERQYSEGYFDYKEDGFGDVLFIKEEMLAKIKHSFKSGFKLENKYAKRVEEFFLLRDKSNSKRIYEVLK